MATALLIATILAAVAAILHGISFARTKALDSLGWALLAAAFAVLWFIQYS